MKRSEYETELDIDYVEFHIFRETGHHLSESGRDWMRGLIRQFEPYHVVEGFYIAMGRYYDEDEDNIEEVANKIGGICYYQGWKKEN